MPILGLDGVQKMSKSLGKYVAWPSARDGSGTAARADDAMPVYYTCCWTSPAGRPEGGQRHMAFGLTER